MTTERIILGGGAGGRIMNAYNAYAVGLLMASIVVCLIWVGLLLGVSFLATPAKFLAPSLSLMVALDVGRHTFAIFNHIEQALTLVVVITILGRMDLLRGLVVFLLTVLVFAQSFYVLPALDLRLDALFLGQSLKPSAHHTIYIALDIAKLLALGFLITLSFKDMLRRVRQGDDVTRKRKPF